MDSENDDHGTLHPIEGIYIDGIKITNAYSIRPVSNGEESHPVNYEGYFGKPIDWVISEDDVAEGLRTLETTKYDRPPEYAWRIENDYADVYFMANKDGDVIKEGDVIAIRYGWPFELETIWLINPINGDMILENKGVPIDIIKESRFSGRRYNSGTGELWEDWDRGEGEGFRIIYKKPLEKTAVATQDQFTEEMRIISMQNEKNTLGTNTKTPFAEDSFYDQFRDSTEKPHL